MAIYPKLILDALATVRYPGNGKDLVAAGMVEDDIRIEGRNLRAGSAPFFIFRKTAPRVGRTLTVWQLDAQDDTSKVLDERYRAIVAF